MRDVMKYLSVLIPLTRLLLPSLISANHNTGFWYGEASAPQINYDSVTYANMTVKVNRPIDEGPGQNLNEINWRCLLCIQLNDDRLCFASSQWAGTQVAIS